jgi:hypothetical protein
MVLFNLHNIIKIKYKNYKKKNNEIISFDEFKIIAIEQFKKIFIFYLSNINHEYIDNIINLNKYQIIISNIGNKFDIKNISSILIYHKTSSSNLIKYYILLLGTHCRFRNFGYGKILLDEFIEKIIDSNKSNKKIKIILKSLETSMDFYKSYGFVKSELKSNKLLFKYENNNELKLNQDRILELNL